MSDLLQRWEHRLLKKKNDVTIMLQQAALLNNFLLTAAASFWLLQSWLDAKQQLLYTVQLSLLYLLFMLLILINLHSYDLSLCWSWQNSYINKINDAILILMNKLTKHATYIATIKNLNAKNFAKLLWREFISHHDMMRDIISNRNLLFTNHFWSTLC